MITPPLPLLVLDGLADDFESVDDLRNHGEAPASGHARVDESEVVAAVRELLQRGLIEAWEGSGEPVGLVAVSSPATDDASLRRYRFRWTPDGKRVWRDGHDVLDAYYAAHPPDGAGSDALDQEANRKL